VRSWGLSVQEQEERWRRGESLRLIARQMGKRGPSVRAFVLQTGGVQRHPPRRAVRCLSMAEREEISRGVAAGEPCRQIAARLGRAPSTVSRELARNGGPGRYRAQAADAAAFRRAQRPKPARLVTELRLRAVVEEKLAVRWSPQRIAGWLPLAYPQDSVMRVSHETIYLSLFVQSRARSAVSCNVACARAGRCAIREASGCPRAEASCATPFPSASDPLRRPTGRCLDIGEATWCSASDPARSGPWSSATAAMSCCSHSPTDSLQKACPSVDRRRPGPARATAPLVDLGSRPGDGRAHPVHHRLWRPGLFL
jgi:Helix-turn-helix domain